MLRIILFFAFGTISAYAECGAGYRLYNDGYCHLLGVSLHNQHSSLTDKNNRPINTPRLSCAFGYELYNNGWCYPITKTSSNTSAPLRNTPTFLTKALNSGVFYRPSIPPVARSEAFTSATPLEARTHNARGFIRNFQYPDLGEAWRDPKGVIWGDLVEEKDLHIRKTWGRGRYMTRQEAISYCRIIGAELPTREDFAQLREYLGARAEVWNKGWVKNYRPDILPNLFVTSANATYARNFWSATVEPSTKIGDGWVFSGLSGEIQPDGEQFKNHVRCIKRMKWRSNAADHVFEDF